MATRPSIDFDIPGAYSDLFDQSIRYLCYYGGRGGAKSQSIARYLILYSLKQRDSVILCLRAYQNSMQESVYGLLKQTIYDHGLVDCFTFFKTEIVATTGTRLLFKGLQNFESIRSLSEKCTLAWVEESQQLNNQTILDDLLPSFRSKNFRFLFSLNPFHDPDPVLETVTKMAERNPKIAKTVKVNYDSNPYFYDNPVLSELMESDRADEARFNHIWLGEPYRGDSQGNQAMDTELLKAALQREGEPGNDAADICIGVDVARFGNDSSVITIRQNFDIIEMKSYQKKSIVQLVDIIKATIQRYDHANRLDLHIDSGGIGGGVLDLCRRDLQNHHQLRIKGFNFGEKAPINEKGYANLISFLWCRFNSILPKMNMARVRHFQASLLSQASRTYQCNEGGEISLEKKSAFSQRIGSSPDEMDSLLLCCHDLIVEEARKARPKPRRLIVLNGRNVNNYY